MPWLARQNTRNIASEGAQFFSHCTAPRIASSPQAGKGNVVCIKPCEFCSILLEAQCNFSHIKDFQAMGRLVLD